LCEDTLTNFAVYAVNNVWILKNSTINSGDVGVHYDGMVMGELDFSDGELGSFEGELESSDEELDSEKEVYIDHNVFLEYDTSIYGRSVIIKRYSSVYNVYHNELINDGEIRGEEGLLADQDLYVIFPEFPEPNPGTENHTVYPGDSLVLESGNYGDITVKTYGTLILTGGTYHIENLILGYYKANIVIQGSTEIIVNNKLTSFTKSYIGPDEDSDIGAKDILIYVNGEDAGKEFKRYAKYFRGFTKAVQIGRYSKIFANIYAPKGTVWIRHDSTVKGSFIGKDVLIGYGVDVTLDSPQPPNPVTYFADPNLEAAIREAIDKPYGDIYKTDLESLEALNASGMEIRDLTGIEDCINLMILVLEYNEIADITPLTYLTKLYSLNLSDNEIEDLIPLAGLMNLTNLYLGGNKLTESNLKYLENLINLTYLSLDYNNISDIDSLIGLKKLINLNLNNNNISDITPLKELTNLSTLYLCNNSIQNIDSLAALNNLSVLYLYDNSISSIGALTYLANLTKLALDYNNVYDISPLSGLKNLIMLYLDSNNIENLEPLRNLNSLTVLVLNSNKISSIAPLAELTELISLSLAKNLIGDVDALKGLLNLDVLRLNDNDIWSITALVENCKTGGLGDGDYVYLYNNDNL
jgi:Leucine-rich repeat (LRR) protein